MSMLQFALTCYAIIGILWASLIARVIVRNGTFHEIRNYGWILTSVIMGLVVLIVGASWPASLFRYIRTGRLRDLFA